MATISDVATAVSLIGKVIKAASDAQMLKKEFKELADYLELVGRQLEMLDDRELGDASMQTFQKMEEILLQCNDLANRCQQRSSIYLMAKGKRIQNELRGAQEKIAKYLTLIPLIHFTQVFRRFKEEDTQINENWNLNTSYESNIPGLVAERIAEFTDNRFQSNARLFTYDQIVKMTFNFKTIIGDGGFGTVFHGYLEDGTEVAIKRRAHSSRQGDKEFLAELRSLTRVCHNNIISLVGYCKDGSNLVIVYEYMPRGSLQDNLTGKDGFLVLTWAQRLQIAYQVAQGLDYLHTGCNPPIVHRDAKSSNILLDSNLEAKITDFGISKALNENDTCETTEVVGTFAYLDPVYMRTGRISKATDVYGFGIILLEMISGQPPIDCGPEGQQHIIEWISLRVDSGADFVDTRMNKYYDPSSVWKVLQLALSCTASSASRRPRMADVAIQLKEIIEMKPFDDIENEQVEVEEAFVTSIVQADRPVCVHRLSANLFTSWTHTTPGRRFWRCKNWKMANDCGYFEWHDPVQENVTIEQMDFVIHQRDELDEEIKMMDCKLKDLEEKIAECKRSKEALEMKSESMDIFYECMTPNLPVVANMATIGDVATAVSLIGKVIKAATDAQMLKKEFKELADYLELVGRQLEMLDDRELGDASMQTFQKMEEVLLQCNDLANSCQQRSSIYLMVKGKRIQNELRGAQEKITKYLTLIPLIHFTQVFRRFKEEDTQINENWNLNTSYESGIPGLVAERIAEFTDNMFQSNAHLFTYEQIVKMTFNFKTIIGDGGFGTVFHGYLEDGTEVAIKRQKHSSSQPGDMPFFAELNLTKVRHRNIISLIGHCKDGGNLAIVYEYMPQGDLQAHLRGKVGLPVLTWAQRLQIAYQAAQGLDYLHTGCNPPIVHRDVKSSNILLGANLEAKITDFGMSKALNENDNDETTRVVGTYGYLDPEYFQTGRVSKASDVYGFGIILLEMISGQHPTIHGPEGQQHIIEWISLRVDSGADFVDTRMNKYYDSRSVQKVFQLALSCTASSASSRPRMAEVAIQLKEIIEMKPFDDMENEQVEVEEAFVTSIAQADRPVCMHQLSANLFTSWTHTTPGRRFWRCKNWKMANDCGYFKWHDPVQENVTIEQMDFVIHQRNELDEEIKMMDEESDILFNKLKTLEEKIAECKRRKETLEMKSEIMDRFYECM